MKKLSLLFAFLLTLFGGTQAWADAITLPYSYGFEDYNLAADGWTTQNPSGLNSGEFAIAGTGVYRTGSYGFRFSSYSSKGDNTQYLISPELNGANGVILSFWYKASSTSGTEKFKVGYSVSDTNVESFSFGDEISYNKTDWTEYTNTFPKETKYIAIYYYSNYQYRLYVDDFTFTAPEVFDGPALKVFDGETAVTTTGYAYNFGLVNPGTEKAFTLMNPGTAAVSVNISATNDFGVSPATATIAAGGETTLTVTMPSSSASGVVTITPTTEGLDAYTINVSGTVKDPNKIFIDFENNPLPATWTKDSHWTISNGKATITYYREYIRSGRIIADKGGENLIFKYARNYSSSYSASELKVYWATTGNGSDADWTEAEGTTPEFEYNVWKDASYSIPDEAKYIAIYGYYVDIDDIYGLTDVPVAIMNVTQPSSLDFDVITQNTTKTFTITNIGTAALENITVTSDNDAFTISNAPTSLVANASQEVTITMSAATIGSFSGKITVSAPDQTPVEFTVTGTVLPTGLTVIDFNNDQIPNDRWTTSGNYMSFSGGAAAFGSNYGGVATLITPKVKLQNYVVLKAKLDYTSSTSYNLTFKGLDNSGAVVYTKVMDNTVLTTSYKYIVLSDIPANVCKIQLEGYYAKLDEIQGINYAPELAVTLDGETVASPATYDFDECNANATVTYNFANIGEGELSITGVAITGDGAAAYSTNFSAMAVPAELKITRTYDASRNGAAQDATITVTTTDGDFVINVTGTDRAANAPELAVDVETLDFGKLAANDTKTVTVTNAGTGKMTVTIASDNELFSVSPAELTEIGAGESKTFDVTFNYTSMTENYGAQNATITVTPTYDGGTAKAIAATAIAKDPAVWSEDFANDPTTDRGWTADNGWSFSNGVAVGGGSGYLTTPYLSVNGTSDELTFEYEGTGTSSWGFYLYYTVRKYGEEWPTSNSYSEIFYPGDKKTFTIKGLEAGVYQIRIKGGSYNLDNFEGFKLFVPEHDAEITAINIPTNGYVGMEYTATVTVKEKMNKAEAATATLYIANTAVATKEVTLTANGETDITLAYTPSEAVSYQAAKIEVTYAGGTLNSESKYVTIKNVTVLDETQENTIAAGNMVSVLLKRQFIAGWNSLCLPFAVTSPKTVFGDDVKAYTFDSYNSTDGLGFKAVNLSNGLDAGTPYLLYLSAAITDDLFFESVTTTASMHPVTKGNVTFQGTYAPITAGNLPAGSYVLTPQAKIAKAGSGASLKAFRAYFTTTGEARMTINFDDNTTAIGAITTDGELEVGTLYNLKGQKVKGNQKGLYIINGKKVVVK